MLTLASYFHPQGYLFSRIPGSKFAIMFFHMHLATYLASISAERARMLVLCAITGLYDFLMFGLGCAENRAGRKGRQRAGLYVIAFRPHSSMHHTSSALYMFAPHALHSSTLGCEPCSCQLYTLRIQHERKMRRARTIGTRTTEDEDAQKVEQQRHAQPQHHMQQQHEVQEHK